MNDKSSSNDARFSAELDELVFEFDSSNTIVTSFNVSGRVREINVIGYMGENLLTLNLQRVESLNE